jgi:hypothetical protein
VAIVPGYPGVVPIFGALLVGWFRETPLDSVPLGLPVTSRGGGSGLELS